MEEQDRISLSKCRDKVKEARECLRIANLYVPCGYEQLSNDIYKLRNQLDDKLDEFRKLIGN